MACGRGDRARPSSAAASSAGTAAMAHPDTTGRFHGTAANDPLAPPTSNDAPPSPRLPQARPSGADAPGEWLIWQLADSAFPTGGFAHSAGLEAAWQHGEVRSQESLVSFVETNLNQLARAPLPFVTAAHAEPDRLADFDDLCEAFTSNHVANRASRVQGRAWLAAAKRIFALEQRGSLQGQMTDRMGTPWCSPVDGLARGLSSPRQDRMATAGETETGRVAESWNAPWGHLAPVFGAVLQRLGLTREMAVRLFIFNHLRGLLAAAVRLNIIGPMQAQTVQHGQSPLAERMAVRAAGLTLADLAQTAPLLDLWQGAQDRLYARLFQS